MVREAQRGSFDPAAVCAGLRQQLLQQREAVEKDMDARKQASSTRLAASMRTGSLIIVEAADSARSQRGHRADCTPRTARKPCSLA